MCPTERAMGLEERRILEDLVMQTLHGEGDSDSHALTLVALVLSTKAKHVIELGVREGRTTLPLLFGVRLTGGTLTSVDTRPTLFQPPDLLRDHWKFHQQDAIEFLRGIRNTVDLVFIDDAHSSKHVSEELHTLTPWVTKRSLLVLHDLMYGGHAPHYRSNAAAVGEFAEGGPYRAVAALDKSDWEYATIPTCNGLTILRRISDDACQVHTHR